MSILNPLESLAPLWPKKLKIRDRIFAVLSFSPAVCALFVFPLIPNYFEAMSLKASKVLDVIELGRGKPWVVFSGLPYPASLRLFGDACGVIAVLLAIMFLINPNAMLFPEKKKRTFRVPSISYWYISLGGFLFWISVFLYISTIHFIFSVPIINPLQLAWHIFQASISLFGIFSGIFMLGCIIYLKITNQL